MLVFEEFEESFGVEPGEFALIRVPSPVEIVFVGSTVKHAVLALFDRVAGCAIVQRAQIGWDPFSLGVVA